MFVLCLYSQISVIVSYFNILSFSKFIFVILKSIEHVCVYVRISTFHTPKAHSYRRTEIQASDLFKTKLTEFFVVSIFLYYERLTCITK